MKARLINIWDLFRCSFWFVPSTMALGAAILALGSCRVDHELSRAGLSTDWLTTTAPAARSTLTSLASATIALAGVVFSITVVTLSIASSQYGSRIVRNVMTASIADLVIGQYVGTSLYCLLVLRAIRDPAIAGTGFVPHVATSVGLLLGLISLAMLIWFIHHVGTAIQAPRLVYSVAQDLNDAVERLFPDVIGDGDPEQDTDGEFETSDAANACQCSVNNAQQHLPHDGRSPDLTIESTAEGYIEGLDIESLVASACRCDGLMAVDIRPGDFLACGMPMVRVWFNQAAGDDDELIRQREMLPDAVNRVVIVGARRTPRQDVTCAAWELVEIAVRALSPGINDPFTAMHCIDRLGAALQRLVVRQSPPTVHCDDDGQPRVLMMNLDGFQQVLNDSFDQIRQNCAADVAVSLRLLEAFRLIASRVIRAADAAAIRLQAESLRDAFLNHPHAPADRDDFDKRFDNVLTTLASRCDMSKPARSTRLMQASDAATKIMLAPR